MIRRDKNVKNNVPAQYVIAQIKKGELKNSDEISAEGTKWIRLDQHHQLAKYFKTQHISNTQINDSASKESTIRYETRIQKKAQEFEEKFFADMDKVVEPPVNVESNEVEEFDPNMETLKLSWKEKLVALSFIGLIAYGGFAVVRSVVETPAEKAKRLGHTPTPTHNSQSIKWYTGGTLHNKTVGDWNSASYKNRLATSADFVTATTPKFKQSKLFEDNSRLLKLRSVALEKCTSESTVGLNVNFLKVSEIAATCITLLGFK